MSRPARGSYALDVARRVSAAHDLILGLSPVSGVSGEPGGREPADVDLVVAASAWGNNEVVEDGGDDRVLAA
jgi:hypothetical protein